MKGCNCKKNNKVTEKTETVPNNDKINIGKYFFNFIVFLFSLILIPFIVIGIIWLLFDMLVLNKDVDLLKIIKKITKNGDFLKHFNESNELNESFDENEYELINVEDLDNK